MRGAVLLAVLVWLRAARTWPEGLLFVVGRAGWRGSSEFVLVECFEEVLGGFELGVGGVGGEAAFDFPDEVQCGGVW